MAKLSRVQLDPVAMDSGRWFPWIYDIELRIASAMSDRFRNRFEDLKRDHADARAIEAVPESEVARKAVLDCERQAAAELLLLDWKNLEDDAGEPIPCSLDRKLEMFKEPRWQHLYRFVINRALAEKNHLTIAARHDEGKSANSSAGG